MTTVRDLMTANVRTVHRDTSIGHLGDILSANNISGAPLVDDQDKLVGFVSKSDISRFDSSGDDPFFVKVHAIANPNVATTQPDVSIEDAGRQMLDQQVHHLLVIEDDALVGILSAFDFIKLAVS